jgi:hypothetical protein
VKKVFLQSEWLGWVIDTKQGKEGVLVEWQIISKMKRTSTLEEQTGSESSDERVHVDKGWSNEWVVTDQEIGEVSFLIV